MGTSQKSSERQLKGMILTRFFLVLVIVGIVELIVVALTNAYLIPVLIVFTKYDKVIRVDGAEGFFVIMFVLIATWIVNWIFPAFKASPEAVTGFLEDLIVRRGFIVDDVEDAKETIHVLSSNPTLILSMIGSLLIVIVILLLPYIIGGIVFSITVAKDIRKLEREKEIERKTDEERRYLMISNIVHELKTPMTTVYGYAKALNDGIVPKEKQSEYHEAIMTKTDRMNEVVALLLDYVKLDSEGFTIKKNMTDICELVRSCCAFCYTDIESSGDEIEINVPEKPLYVSLDSVQMSRVITNLITNAIRHNESGTKIGVHIKCENYSTAEDVRIFVSDTGKEIPSPLSEQIFDPFVTGDESRASGAGTGLGLALSTKICDMHGFSLKLIQKPEIKRYNLGDEYNKVFVVSM